MARLAEACGRRVLSGQTPGGPERADRLPLHELLPRVDALTLHCPLNEHTRHMLGARELALLKPNALVVNTARGGLIDEQALADALRSVVMLPSTGTDASGALSTSVVRWLLWVVLAAQAASLAARLGPVGVSGAGVRWWVPTAVDRAGLLVGSWWATLALWTAGTSAAGPPRTRARGDNSSQADEHRTGQHRSDPVQKRFRHHCHVPRLCVSLDVCIFSAATDSSQRARQEDNSG